VNSRWTGRPTGTAPMRRGSAAGASSRGGDRQRDIEVRGSIGRPARRRGGVAGRRRGVEAERTDRWRGVEDQGPEKRRGGGSRGHAGRRRKGVGTWGAQGTAAAGWGLWDGLGRGI
jgi:hypothetical protein